MTKKLSSKLLSVILALAICATTVFGCLITANAADAVCCAQWSDGATSTENDVATIYLALHKSSKFENEGINTIRFVFSTDSILSVKNIAVVESAEGFESGAITTTPYDTDKTFDINDLNVVVERKEDGEVTAVVDTYVAYDTVVFKIELDLSEDAKMGESYKIYLNQVEVGTSFDEHTHNFTPALEGIINTNCDHVLSVQGNPINIDGDYEYAVYESSVCVLCKKEFGYQLVPSTEVLSEDTITWSGKTEAIDLTKATGEEGDPHVIENAEQLAWLASQATIAQTHEKYFRLADNIDNIVLQADGAKEIMAFDNYTDVEAYFTNDENDIISWVRNDGSTTMFCGHFDGNGATIYGMSLGSATEKLHSALFGYMGVSASVSNIAVENSYGVSYQDGYISMIAGQVMGYTAPDGTTVKNTSVQETTEDLNGDGKIEGWVNTAYEKGYVTFDNIKIANCKITIKDPWCSRSQYSGLLVGYVGDYTPVHINGLVMYGNDMEYSGTLFPYTNEDGETTPQHLTVMAGYIANDNPATSPYIGTGVEGCYIKNSLLLDTEIVASTNANTDLHTTNGKPQTAYSAVYTNVTTTEAEVKPYQYKDGKYYLGGTKGDTIYYVISTELAAEKSNGGLTIIDVGENYANVKGYNATTTCPNLSWGDGWSYGTDGEYPSLVSDGLNIIYWDGTTGSHPTEQAEDGTYIINTAEELHYIAQRNDSGKKAAELVEETAGKKYKIADGIDVIILQPQETVIAAGGVEKLMNLSSSDATYDYFTNSDVSFTPWVINSSEVPFNGSFDGNGVEIYGLYADGTQTNAGLFRAIDSGTPDADGYNATGNTFKNFAIKNSYLEAKRRMGAIAALSREADYNQYGTANGLISVENCEISNCYMYCNSTNTYERTVNDVKVNTYNVALTGNGVLVGTLHSTSDVLQVKNCLVYGNYAKFKQWTNKNVSGWYHVAEQTEDTYQLVDIQIIGDTGNNKEIAGTNYKFELHSSVVLGTPWNTNFTLAGGYYTNVYTDQTQYTADQLAQYNCGGVTTNDIIGTQAKDNMPNLAWGTDWQYSLNGYPVLTALSDAKAENLSNGAFGLVGSNISYNNDGSIDFNFHYIPTEGYEPVLYVGKADGSGYTPFVKVSEPTESSMRDALSEVYGGEIGQTAMMFTISNLSSRDINTAWVPTLVATNGAVKEWGKSQLITIADYAKSVLNDKVTYEEGVTDDTKLADKKVAAALLNYADAATTVLNTTNDIPTQKTKTIYWDTWGAGDETSIDALNDTKASGDSWEDPIIIDNANELYWLCRVSTYDVTADKYFKVSDNIKNFILQPSSKVDGDELMAMTDANEVKDYLTGISGVFNWSGDNGSFNGHFDGNGVNVYGLHSTSGYVGLFGRVDGGTNDGVNYYTFGTKKVTVDGVETTVPVEYYYDYSGNTIKNINLKNSYMRSWAIGGIVAGSYNIGSAADVAGLVNVTGCSVSGCYLTNDDGTTTGANQNLYNKGLIVGSFNTYDRYAIDNCLVYGNVGNFYTSTSASTRIEEGITTLKIAGATSDCWYPKSDTDHANGTRAINTVTNTICIDAEPYLIDFSYSGSSASSYENIYTTAAAGTVTFNNTYKKTADDGTVTYPNYTCTFTETDIKQVSAETFASADVEAACPNLDWESDWMTTSGYPQPIQSGYVSTAGKTIYWSGDTDKNLTDEGHDYSTQDGTADNPIIIDSAEELYYVIRVAGNTVTGGNYYRIADGIDTIVLQPEGVLDLEKLLACKNGTEVKAYFDTLDASNLKGWTSSAVFNGNIDGNGVQIVGLYDTTSNLAGLIGAFDGGKKGELKQTDDVDSYDASTYVCTVDGCNEHRYDSTNKKLYHVAVNTDNVGNTVSNITVGYSYMVSGNRLGVFGAQSYSNTYGAYVNGTWNVDTCAVINCYMNNTARTYSEGKAGVVTGECGGEVVKLNNVLVYGNNATDKNGAALWARSGVRNDQKLVDDTTAFNYNTITNSIILGASPYPTNYLQSRISDDNSFSNVYTDAPVGTVTFGNGATHTYSDEDLKGVIDLSTLKGSNAAGIVSALNGDNGTTWYVGAIGDYPGFEEADAIPSWLDAEYDNYVIDKFNTINTTNGGVDSSIFGLKSVSLNLKANPYMSFIFAFKDEYKTNRENISVRFVYTDFYGTETATEWISVPAYTDEDINDVNGWTNGVKNGRYHTYQFRDLPVAALTNDIYVYAKYDSGDENAIGEVLLGTVSAAGLGNDFIKASKEYPCEYYNACVDASKALLFYTEMLKDRYGPQNN